jgi:hypothetical protein
MRYRSPCPCLLAKIVQEIPAIVHPSERETPHTQLICIFIPYCRPCSRVRAQVCPRRRGWANWAICPRGARGCSAFCCQPYCTARGLWCVLY